MTNYNYRLELGEQWEKFEEQLKPLLKSMKQIWIRNDLSLNENFEFYCLRSANTR